MSLHTVTIIAEPSATVDAAARTRGVRRFSLGAAGLAVGWGTIAAAVYYAQGLALSHYDARAHLVVARRIIDSLTPGWEQIGAVWLPLPHLLNMLPVQIDLLYRTGASGIALSVASFGVAVFALTALILDATGSRTAAGAAALLFALNPNILYLQSTPMTEPLLLALLMLAAWSVYRWTLDPPGWRRIAGWSLVGACLTRYESFPFTGAALVLAAAVRWAQGHPPRDVLREIGRLGLYPALAIAAFMVHSRMTVGHWFVTGGFYVVDPTTQGDALAVTAAIWWGTSRLGSYALIVSSFGAIIVLVRAAIQRRQPSVLVTLALCAVAALPWYAFYQGHPFRIRYMVPLVAAAVACTGMALGFLRPGAQRFAAAAVLLGTVATTRPFDSQAAMVREGTWDVAKTRAREIVTGCLAERNPNDVVLMSMGSLAHYMQNLSRAGYDIQDFIHEGNGNLWDEALRAPADHVNWVVVEERSEGGDIIARRIGADPRYLREFARVCEAAGVALYRRQARPTR